MKIVNIIIHKIVKYVENPDVAKLFFFLREYRRLINTSNSHFDELYFIYGNRYWFLVNNLKSVQAMLRLDILGDTTDPIDYTAENGHLEIIKWLHENLSKIINSNNVCTTYAMNIAAAQGHLEIVKWLHENRNEGCTTTAMDYAASNSHIEVVKWLHENRKEGCTTLAMNLAAKNGHSEIVNYLKNNIKNNNN